MKIAITGWADRIGGCVSVAFPATDGEFCVFEILRNRTADSQADDRP